MTDQEGGCLCGQLRYAASAPPVRITICHCTFCQRATGSDHLIEPVFQAKDFRVARGAPSIYAQTSKGSGKQVAIHFCPTCGTKLFLTFERLPDAVGVYGVTFDDPSWFGRDPRKTWCLFLDDAPVGAIIPAGVPTFRQHRLANDGALNDRVVFDAPHVVGEKINQ